MGARIDTLRRPAVRTEYKQLTTEEVVELACREHPGVWAERYRHFENAGFHWEWYEMFMTEQRMAVVAPREHAKSEVFTVNCVTHRLRYWPGTWAYVFAQTGDQAKLMKARIDQAMWETNPWMMEDAKAISAGSTQYANWSKVDVAGAGKAVRGVHPDLILGDDVLEEGNTMTEFQRKKAARWWFGTIGGMAHPGTWRTIGQGEDAPRVWMPPTKVVLVGTPFHAQDLLMQMRENPLYKFRRYSAEYDPDRLVPGTHAVEVAG